MSVKVLKIDLRVPRFFQKEIKAHRMTGFDFQLIYRPLFGYSCKLLLNSHSVVNCNSVASKISVELALCR